ncbi:lipid-A-disaccharide synthase-related protein [Deinococcus maricopensis]|nr:lipid-A-disaccharide synthase-related protein [Deinococcus maricopensis]
MPDAQVLIVSNGVAEDLIGARLAHHLRGRGLHVQALTLVGAGGAYADVAERVGPALALPSGGFPFGSAANLRADLRAGLISASLRQWAAGWRAGHAARGVIAVGDAYALMVARLAAGAAPLYHVQPLVSVHYGEGMTVRAYLRELNALGANAFMPWEVALARRARRVYTRDAASARFLFARGVSARHFGSFALDVLPDPELDLTPLRDGRPVLALVPGSRADAPLSLPVMLAAATHLPDLQAFVAWAPPLDALPIPDGWTRADRSAAHVTLQHGHTRVEVLRGAFGSVARAARVALATAGTATEQLAGLGVPSVAFVTGGPQFTPTFAARQARLLGAALTLTRPDPHALARAAQHLHAHPAARADAARDGRARIGQGGALPELAREISLDLLGR